MRSGQRGLVRQYPAALFQDAVGAAIDLGRGLVDA
jgi:hypothetical protein